MRVSVFATLLFSTLAWADPTGTIAGSVSDPTGAAIVGAKIAVINSGTGLKREATTAADGGYVFPLLPVGVYTVTVEANGFRRTEQRGVEVKTDESVTVPVKLEIGSSQQSVTVQATAEMVETRSGALRDVIGSQPIVELPLNGRTAASLILLMPGTADLTATNARGAGDTQQSTTYPGSMSVTANGGRADFVNYYLDGGSNVDFYTHTNLPFPNPDAVEEFSIQTNSYSAEFGRGAGGVVNLVSKNGTNQFHGSAFDFLRNGDLDARNFFGATGDVLKRNQFGGSVGGPIRKDKLFFFGTYQGTQLRNVLAATSATVFTPAQRNGDFSSYPKQLVNPYAGNAPFPNNQIPTSLFTPASTQLLSLIPLPTSTGGVVYYAQPDNEHETQAMGRVDYDLSKHRIYGKYFYSHYSRDAVSGAQDIVTAKSGLDLADQSVSASDTYTITPTLLNNFVFSYTRYFATVVSAAPFTIASLGIPIASTTPPEISIAVTGYFSVATGHPGHFNRHDYHFTDSLHWIHGSHEIAVGGDIMRAENDLINTYRQNGGFTFNTAGFTGLPLADFLIGDVQKFTQGGGEYAARVGNLGSLFVQDNYRVTKKFVVNLGMRWDPFPPYTDKLGRAECFIPGQQSQRFPNSPTGYIYAGDPNCPAGGFKSSWSLFAPRAGFAYSIDNKTTIRGGWGLFYQPPFVEAFNNFSDSAPFSPQIQFLGGVPFMNPYHGTPNPFPAQFAPFVPPSNATFALPQALAVSYQPSWTPAYSMNWNVTVERQLSRDYLLRVSFVASKGTHLSYNTDVNAPLPSPTATAANENARRPYQQFVQITQDQSGGNSEYDALQVSMEKRLSHGIAVSANYTWSKSLDAVSTATDLCGLNTIDPYNIRAYRAVSDYNVPQRLVLNYNWQLPSPKAGLEKALLGGWGTTAIWTWQSGFPLDITSGGDYSFSNPGFSNDQANVISKPQYTSGSLNQKLSQWFTTSSFTVPAPNTFGTVGRNTLRGPGTFNVDFGAHRVFDITERLKLQFRGEFFNFFNNSQFNNPNTTVTNSNFGRITSARNPRIIQMALKVIF
jgi:Carboxypeptidase regulatory-like domain/TonB dependent receptor